MPYNEGQSTLFFGPWYRKSPFFEATQRAGAKAYDIYNHMYLPGLYTDPFEEYWHLVNHVTLWDVSVERQVEIGGKDGAKFAELGLEAKDAQDQAGYAKAQSEEFYRKQQEMMLRYVAAADVVIPTALVPGKRAPILITEEMVRNMRPGSVIVDLAAEQGGNCALTEPGHEVVKHGVLILGPINLPSTVPYHASQMYARTVTNYLLHLVKAKSVQLDLSDELTRGPLVTHQGEIVHEAVKGTR